MIYFNKLIDIGINIKYKNIGEKYWNINAYLMPIKCKTKNFKEKTKNIYISKLLIQKYKVIQNYMIWCKNTPYHID